MSLAAGARIGVYEIVGPIGAGGMGEVYRARDSRLQRDIAIKVLPEAFAADRDRLARFEREAQVLASLNHPNIATIHGFEDADGMRALVLELVDGPTLADRLKQGVLPLDEALPVARQIAEALEAAHEHGVVHRDLKPANIKLRPDGTVKVLDFGLAKAFDVSDGVASAALSTAPTLTSPAATGLGVILGTAAYMAPEQAKGKHVDRRADIWAFGCVLYEMLTGRRAFGGEEISETLAEVIRGEPDWKGLPAETPAAVRRLLRRCFIKDPKARLSDAAVLRLEIDDARTPEPKEPHGALPATSWRRLLPYAAAVVVTSSVALPAGWLVARREPPSPELMRFTVDLPPGVQLARNAYQRIVISSNGRRIAYTGSDQGGISRLYVRSVDQLDAVAIRGVDRLGSVFISPEGEWIGYSDPQTGGLRKVPAGGGPTATICEIPGGATTPASGFLGATWSTGGQIVFATVGTRGLMHVSDAGGTPEPLTLPPEDESHRDPHFLPDGRSVLFVIERMDEPDRIAVASLDDPEPRVLMAGNSPKYVASGHLVFLREDAAWTAAFDVGRLSVVGNPVPVLEGFDAGGGEAARYDVARNGALVYSPGEAGQATRTLTWVDRQGREESIPAPPRAYSSVRLSPDGSRIAVEIEQNDIWIWDLRGQTLTRVTFDGGQDQIPVWTPDGRRIAFRSNRNGQFNLFWRAADGTGVEERLSESANGQAPTAFSPDGTRLVFDEGRPSSDIMALDVSGSRAVTPVVQTQFPEYYGDVSLDGRWIAYQYLESDPSHIVVRPFPDVQTGRWQISTMGGRHPVWSRNGRELFYLDLEGRLTSVGVDTTAGFRATAPRRILERGYFEPIGMRSYDVSPDGQRFLMIKAAITESEGARAQVVVVLNWHEELKRRVPVN